jgi:hypothetical protein
MNVSEIMDAELRYLAIQGATLAIKSLAQAELDGRSEAKAGPLPRAKYWRHGDTRDGFMTIDGKIEAIMDRGKVSEPKVVKGDKLTCPQCLANEITADEWVAIQRGALWPCQHLHGGVAPYIYQGGCDCSTGLCNHEECKPTERAEIEPLPFLDDRTDDLPIAIRRMNMFIHCMQGIINRLEAVERRGK